jgi:hypothetical protein
MKTKPTIYTEDFVLEQVRSILELILLDKGIIYLGEIFEELPYSIQRFSEWAETFKENEEISETIKRIKNILESRVNVAGLKGKANPTMVIFNLKNNYNWRDKQETELSNPDGNLKTIIIQKSE